jgi:hypothetical protein
MRIRLHGGGDGKKMLLLLPVRRSNLRILSRARHGGFFVYGTFLRPHALGLQERMDAELIL